jgi:dTDP-4-dehydrorhamnose reductase
LSCTTLVFGAGRIGALLAQQNETVSLSHSALNVCSRTLVERAVAKYRPSRVINAAALTSLQACELDPDAAWNTNYLGAKNIADVCKEAGIYSLQLSTDSAKNPVNVYGFTKRAAEDLGFSAFLRFNCFDECHWIIQKLVLGTKLHLLNGNVFNPVYIQTLIRVIVMMTKRKLVGRYELGTEEVISYHDLAMMMSQRLRLASDLEAVNRLDLPYKIPNDCAMVNNVPTDLLETPKILDEVNKIGLK